MITLDVPAVLKETGCLYIFAPGGEKHKLAFKLPAGKVQVKSVKQLDEITQPGLLLAKSSLLTELVQKGIPQNVWLDALEHWTTGEISVSSLLKIGVFDYVDYHHNHIRIHESISPEITIIRQTKSGVIMARQNGVRLGCVTVQVGNIKINLAGSRAYVRIDDQTTTKGLTIGVTTNGKVLIGEDVMMARHIEMYQADGHMIFDLDTGERVNKGRDIIVGRHVWLGRNVMLLGGASIPDGCIVGARSLTAHRFEEKNCVIAGSPAKVLRRRVVWSRDGQDNDYQNFSQCKDKSALEYL